MEMTPINSQSPDLINSTLIDEEDIKTELITCEEQIVTGGEIETCSLSSVEDDDLQIINLSEEKEENNEPQAVPMFYVLYLKDKNSTTPSSSVSGDQTQIISNADSSTNNILYEVPPNTSNTNLILNPYYLCLTNPSESTNSNVPIVLNSQFNSQNKAKEPPTEQSIKYKCSVCNLEFSNAKERNSHVVSHSVAPTHKCKICQGKFSYVVEILKHLKDATCHDYFPKKCFYCKSLLLNVDAMLEHQEKPMKRCPCGRKLCGEASYAIHQKCFNHSDVIVID